MTTSVGTSTGASWQGDRESWTNVLPTECRPGKLGVFVEFWLPEFMYRGPHNVGYVYRCGQNVSAWGVKIRETPDRAWEFVPQLRIGRRGHPDIGLHVLEMQGLDDEVCLLVIMENADSEKDPLIYGLILDTSKISDDLVETCQNENFLYPPSSGTAWTPDYIMQQWKWMEEAQQAKAPKPILTPSPVLTDSQPQEKGRKRKSTPKTPNPASSSQKEKGKKAKGDPQGLTIEQCLNFTKADLTRMKRTEVEAIGKVLDEAFKTVYIHKNKPLTEEDPDTRKDALKLVHFNRLHRAPPGGLVYRGIQKDRLEGIINAVRASSKATAPEIHIRVLPLKTKPQGSKVDFFVTKPTIEDCLNDSTHFYIIGGQHTVEAHKILAIDLPATWTLDEISHFSVIPVWTKPDPKDMTLLQLSRALNQDLTGLRKEQCFTEQLMTCRVKWREFGKPAPELYGRPQSEAFSAFQRKVVPSVFTHLGRTDPKDAKIPLLFEMNDAVVEKWMNIDKMFIAGVLPDSNGVTGDPAKLKRKPLVQNDFKPLYKMRAEDLDYLADLVLAKKVCVKSSKAANQGTKPGQAETLENAANREKRIRAMKSELMLNYKDHPLPSKSADFVPYSKEQWDEFAEEKNIGRAELESWVDAASHSAKGKAWLDGRLKAINKETDATPDVLVSIWKQHIPGEDAEETPSDDTSLFDSKYSCRVLPDSRGEVAEVLIQPDIQEWRGDKAHLYFWFLYSVRETTSRAQVLDTFDCNRIFNHLEVDMQDGRTKVRSPSVLITDQAGFFELRRHIEARQKQSKTKERLWSTHVVYYIPGKGDGFPTPDIGVAMTVYCVFMYQYDAKETPAESFKKLFKGHPERLPAYISAAEHTESIKRWQRPNVPQLRISVLDFLFTGYVREDMVVVNVMGGPHLTYLGLTHDAQVLEIVNSEEGRLKAVADAEEIFKYHLNIVLDPNDNVAEDLAAVDIAVTTLGEEVHTRAMSRATGTGEVPASSALDEALVAPLNLSVSHYNRMESLADAIDGMDSGTDSDGMDFSPTPPDPQGDAEHGSRSEPIPDARMPSSLGEGILHSAGQYSPARGPLHDTAMSDPLNFDVSQRTAGDLPIGLPVMSPHEMETVFKSVEDVAIRDTEDSMDQVSAEQTVLELQAMSPPRSRSDRRPEQLPEKGKTKAVARNPGSTIPSHPVGIRTRAQKDMVSAGSSQAKDDGQRNPPHTVGVTGVAEISKDTPPVVPGPTQLTSLLPQPNRVDQVRTPRIYHLVFDLNGVLVSRGEFRKGQPWDIKVRPGCTDLLNWVQQKATLSFWSSVIDKNMKDILSVLRRNGANIPEDVTVLTQSACYKSSYVHPSYPNRPIFVKDLEVFIRKGKPKSLTDVLLLDDSPIKNVLNDPFSAVHPPSWTGAVSDTYLDSRLKPWLAGLLASDADVPDYVRRNSLPGGYAAVVKSSPTALAVVEGITGAS